MRWFLIYFLVFLQTDLLFADQCVDILKTPFTEVSHRDFNYKSTTKNSIHIANHLKQDELGVGFDLSGHSIIFLNGRRMQRNKDRVGFEVSSYITGRREYTGEVFIIFKDIDKKWVQDFQQIIDRFDEIPLRACFGANCEFSNSTDLIEGNAARPISLLNKLIKAKIESPESIEIITLENLNINGVKNTLRSIGRSRHLGSAFLTAYSGLLFYAIFQMLQ